MSYKHKFERLFFTISIIVLYRFTTFLSVPGLDLSILNKFYSDNSSILGIFNAFSGGSISRMSIMALNLMPYVSSSIIVQLLTALIPEWKELKKDSYQRKKINQYSRLIALVISFVQSLGIAIGLENVPSLVLNPGLLFKFTTVLSIMSGSLLIMWLAERITEYGIGNGSSIVIFTGIVCNSTPNILMNIKRFISGELPYGPIVLAIALLFIFGIIFCELIRYLIKIYFKTPAINQATELASNYFPIKINPSGILPAMFADSMMIVPSIILRVLDSRFSIKLPEVASNYVLLLAKSFLILFFCIFCLSLVMNPQDVAESLQSRNAFIDGVPEGLRTALFFKRLLNQISIIGCVYMIMATVLPDLLSLAFFGSRDTILISGTSLLIVIGVALEIYERMSVEPKINTGRPMQGSGE